MTTPTPTVAPARPHYHVSESTPGCLPETDPVFATDPEAALSAAAEALADWAEAHDEETGTDEEATGALAVAEIYRGSSAEHGDLLARLDRDGGLAEYVGDRVVETVACTHPDCAKYCPDPGCGTVTALGDSDPRCWCCGAPYVAWDACGWLD
jgi:hypothetical protein